jgi:hypothetical protein
MQQTTNDERVTVLAKFLAEKWEPQYESNHYDNHPPDELDELLDHVLFNEQHARKVVNALLDLMHSTPDPNFRPCCANVATRIVIRHELRFLEAA